MKAQKKVSCSQRKFIYIKKNKTLKKWTSYEKKKSHFPFTTWRFQEQSNKIYEAQ